jgi:predicted nucleic-acid-binding protein
VIGLDTNVLVRYIMQDDPVQAAKATALVEALDADAPGFVALVSIIELHWVLTSCYDLTQAQVMQALETLLRAEEIVVDQAEQVLRALRACAGGKGDFADCLIERTAAAAGCTRTMTFDMKAGRHAGMTLLR